jgi:xanthine dehydrogenase molybdenum-binding subunit
MENDYLFVGKSIPRIDNIEKVTGRAKYAVDLKADTMLYAKVLRSPHPHARVISVNTDRIKDSDHVKAIATIEEVPKIAGMWFSLRTEKSRKGLYLKDDTVRFIGDPVLAVAADDEQSAEKALSLIDVEYEILPPLFEPFESMNRTDVAIHKKGNIAFRTTKIYGDPEKGFGEADCVFENEFKTSRQKHASIEPVGSCLASYGSDDSVIVHSSTQLPHWTQIYLADILDLPVNRVRVVKPFTGGAFGARCGIIHGLEAMCCVLSRKTKRPVKMSFTREEDFEATEGRHPFTVKLKTGATKEGLLVAHSIELVMDVGGYGTHYVGVLADALSTGLGLYRCPNVRFEGVCVYTNKAMNGAMRGYGNPQINFAQESQMDIIADHLGMDPVELRLKNYRGLGEVDPVFEDTIKSDGMKECLKKGAERIKWEEKRAKKHIQGTTVRGVGMSCLSHGTGASLALPDPASAIVMFNSDGSVNLVTAAADDGQGNRTGLLQIAAEELGIPVEQISISPTDTASTPLDGGTHGSRQTYAGGLAVKKAAVDAKAALFTIAARFMATDSKDLNLEGGMIFSTKNPSVKVSLHDFMRRIAIEDMSVNEQIIGHSTGIAPGMPTTFGANFAEVEVDLETGEVTVIDFVSAFDVGRAINPANVEGQIVGGAIMGIGFALTEEMITVDGRIQNANFRDYRLLRACDVPNVQGIIVESNEPTGPYGAKGVGEATMIGVPAAIANAIFHATGVRIRDLCITQEKVLEGLQSKK